MTTHTTIPVVDTLGSETKLRLTRWADLMLQELKGMTPGTFLAAGNQTTDSAAELKYPAASNDWEWSEEAAGRTRYARLGEHFYVVPSKPWTAGAAIKANILRQDDWLRQAWGQQPQEAADTLIRLKNNTIVRALINGETLPSMENRPGSTTYKLFQVDHPSDPTNPSGPYKYTNLHTSTPLSAENLIEVFRLFDERLAADGNPRELVPAWIWCGSDNKRLAMDLWKRENLPRDRGDTNLVLLPNEFYYNGAGSIQGVLSSPLITDGSWGLIAPDMGGKAPWEIIVKTPPNSGAVGGMPGPGPVGADGIEWIISDERSAMYMYGADGQPPGTVAIKGRLEFGLRFPKPWLMSKCTP